MGICEKYWLECDWCGEQPGPDEEFDSREAAAQEMTRVSRYEGWFLKSGDTDIFMCPECVAEGKARG